MRVLSPARIVPPFFTTALRATSSLRVIALTWITAPTTNQLDESGGKTSATPVA